jgi:hypothetical protein
MSNTNNLPKEMMALLEKYSKTEGYINPHFLMEVTGPLYMYYELESDAVDTWVQEMFGL